MKRLPFLHLSILCLIATGTLPAKPPPAPEGYEWVRNEQFSDEFEGTKLDETKWFDYHPWWKGRPPAKFDPSTISLQDGFLVIRNKMLPEPDGPFTIAGGAVVSRKPEAFYGYYEVRMKASKVSMSSTFWLSNRAIEVEPGVRISDEIDIVEAIGAPQHWPDWNKFMKSNLHVFRHDKDGTVDLASPGQAPLDPPSGEAFHVYAAWWVDANTIHFYLDDEYQFTLHPKTDFSEKPFVRPMQINMVTETYNWEVPPTPEELADDSRNATYYDWVRAWVLKKKED